MVPARAGEARGTLEKAPQLAGHESPRPTKLYDRTRDGLDEGEIEGVRF